MRTAWTETEITYLKSTKELLMREAYERYKKAFPEAKRTYQSFAQKRSRIGCCKAEDKKLVWTKEKCEFVKECSFLPFDKAYEKFCKRFGTETTRTAYRNQRSRMGLSKHINFKRSSTKKRPLYSEHENKGYIFIKVAQPSTWISKARWVWQETHPGELVEETDCFYFLDGNNRNFNPENIERVEKRLEPIIPQTGGIVKGDPEASKINILRARLKLATFDMAEKAGLCYKTKRGRMIKK